MGSQTRFIYSRKSLATQATSSGNAVLNTMLFLAVSNKLLEVGREISRKEREKKA